MRTSKKVKCQNCKKYRFVITSYSIKTYQEKRRYCKRCIQKLNGKKHKGFKMPKKAKEKLRELALKQFENGMPEETKMKIKKAITGRKYSKEHCLNMSKSLMGNTRNLGNKQSEETKRKISKAHIGKAKLWNIGKNNFNWKDGITKLTMKIRTHLLYKNWRRQIYKRDDFICQMFDCDKTEKYLNAHHIKPFNEIISKNNIKTIEEAINCKELWDIKNGITLCEKCHHKIRHKEHLYPNLNSFIKK